MKTKNSHSNLKLFCVISACVIIVVSLVTALGDVPQPVLSITSLGSNQFNIVITNAVTTTNYTLFWTPALADPNYPWEVLSVGSVGQTNFTVNGGGLPREFFRTLVGSDSDGDGVPDWQDADPFDPNVGQLQVIIYSPANGSTISN